MVIYTNIPWQTGRHNVKRVGSQLLPEYWRHIIELLKKFIISHWCWWAGVDRSVSYLIYYWLHYSSEILNVFRRILFIMIIFLNHCGLSWSDLYWKLTKTIMFCWMIPFKLSKCTLSFILFNFLWCPPAYIFNLITMGNIQKAS